MQEAIDLAHELANAPSLLPYLVFAIVCCVCFAERKTIKDYFVSKIEANREIHTQNIIQNELLRTLKVALDNNTAAFSVNESDRGETRKMLAHHDEMSAERDARILAIVKRIDDNVSTNVERLGIIEDRTENSR